jgi:soluble lytic murein transglycosylase-like protein
LRPAPVSARLARPPKLLTLKHIFVISALALCVLVWTVTPAQAQIYSWRDANGVLTLSDRPQNASAQAITVSVGTPAVVSRGGNPVYEPLIRQHASNQGVRPDLVRAVIQVESAFNPKAVSPKGAMGLMQLMPATARELGVVDPFNPAENIRAGVTYLRRLLDRYDDNEQLALAAYNAGPTAVDKYGSKVPPYKETRDYVQRITGIQGTLRNGPEQRIYKVTEIIDGREVISYTNVKPSSGTFEEVRR